MFSVSPRFLPYNIEDLLRLADELTERYPAQRPSSGDGYNLTPAASRLALARHGDSEVHNTDKEFRIRLDLHHYSPEEVRITCDNLRITINAKHEERQDDHGYVSREITRTYRLPADVDVRSVASSMNTHGVLNIRIAKKAIQAPTEIPVAVEIM
ncbi:unnamed protein product [Candidula unifasciata]|uniref:SHSP domain-containing protein n=1 Tax=Candidula unifasciata TaxID=100452 RepID=A0A8S3YH31_9EUPU|nr:unnamed protein product [Candidula unifasciata]